MTTQQPNQGLITSQLEQDSGASRTLPEAAIRSTPHYPTDYGQTLLEDDCGLPIMGYTTVVDCEGAPSGRIYYTASTLQVVNDWKGLDPSVPEPVVRRSDALRQINELSDLVTSLCETIEELRQQVGEDVSRPSD